MWGVKQSKDEFSQQWRLPRDLLPKTPKGSAPGRRLLNKPKTIPSELQAKKLGPSLASAHVLALSQHKRQLAKNHSDSPIFTRHAFHAFKNHESYTKGEVSGDACHGSCEM